MLTVIILVTLGAFAQAEDESEGKLTTKYDAGKDETEISINYLPIKATASNKVFMHLSVTFSGKKLKSKPDDVILVMSVVSLKNHRYPDINQVNLASEGKSISKMILLNLDQRKFSDTEIFEPLGTRIETNSLKKLGQTKAPIEFKINNGLFTIDRDVIAKLAEFHKAIVP